jgi:hypothetical protein
VLIFSLSVDEREAGPMGHLGQFQPSVNLAIIAEDSETKPEVTSILPQGSPELLIHSEDTPGLSKSLPVRASKFPDSISFSEPEIALTHIQDNNVSTEGQIGTHATVNSASVSSTIFSVKVAGAQGIVLINWKFDSFVAEDFAWTCGGDLGISHVKVIARGNSEVHMVIFTLSMTF